MSWRYPFAFWLMIAALGWGAAQLSDQYSKPVVVQLEVKAEVGILISRLNPPSIKLVNPFEAGEILTGKIDGELSRDQPKFYYTRLKPVMWYLRVPDSVAPGSYPAEVRAIFSLCSTARGFCYTDQHKATTTLQVGEKQKNVTIVFRLRQPKG